MPHVLSGPADVHDWAHEQCFGSATVGTVGAEVESVVVDRARPERRVPVDELLALATQDGPLPCGSDVHVEPGGQLEVATTPLPGPQECADAVAADLAEVRRRLEEHGVELGQAGTDPVREPQVLVAAPRYDAMAAYFATGRHPEAGPLLMGCSASVQVSVEAGRADDDGPLGRRRRWALAHALGPPLVAAFACSPMLLGRADGARSVRQQLWERVDPSRVLPVLDPGEGEGPAQEWAEHLLSARLMLVRDPDGAGSDATVPVLDGSTLRDWVDGRVPGRRPTTDDLAYHATTMFPPVRPRGPLELRYLDRVPDAVVGVPVGVVCGLLDDETAADQAEAVAAPVRDDWSRAAQEGVADAELRRAAVILLDWRATRSRAGARTGWPRRWRTTRPAGPGAAAARRTTCWTRRADAWSATVCVMESVGVRAVRQDLSVWLRRVQEGAHLRVTDRGRPVALLQPLPARDDAEARYVAAGVLVPAEDPDAPLPEAVPAPPGPPSQVLLREMRDEERY